MLPSNFPRLAIFPTFAFLATVTISNLAWATDSANDRSLYIGAEYGVSEPIVKSFRHEDSGTNTVITLKRSQMIGGKVGYSFYPGMAIEVSGTYQPKFNLGYRLPSFDVPIPQVGTFNVPKTNGKTKVDAFVVTANLVYTLKETVYNVKPYILFGLGYSRINVKASSEKITNIPFIADIEFFRINKTQNNCFTKQAGLGFVSKLTDNIEFDISAKMQIVDNVKIKYQTLNIKTQEFERKPDVKKTIAVGEFGVGLTFRLPV